jgi:hypothetical protein
MLKNKIFIPTKNADCWKGFLVDKDKQWQKGFSAMETALSWEKANGLPAEIKKILSQDDEFDGVELLLAIPEYKVSLPGGSSQSQNDVFAVLTSKKSLTVMTVEGKAKEDFGKKIVDWKAITSDKGVSERLEFLINTLGIKDKEIGSLRYQLFHRLASAIIMAKQFHAKNAVMIIQSFNDNDKQNHFNDYAKFIELYNIQNAEKSKLYKLTELNGITVYAGWVYSECEK